MARLTVKVVTRASRDRVAGMVGDRLKVCVTVAPERGRANARVVETLAEFFGVPERCVRIVAGETASVKQVEIAGLGPKEAARRINAAALCGKGSSSVGSRLPGVREEGD
ncbi:MAG: DUF167 domain-containing protein [Planctomycetes bacterium]|nr:DUF167 domain-containing protein [Planctomycetota bacterium]